MITLNNAESVLDHLSERSISIDSSHCVRVRNRHSSCRACQEVCPAHAIAIENNDFSLDIDICTECGACANVCPTQALSSAAIPHIAWARFAHSLRGSNQAERQVWICCKEHPLAHKDLDHLLVLPCLAHLDEVHYLLLAYYGTKTVLLHAPCDTCSNGSVRTVYERTLERTRVLADSWNIRFDCDEIEEFQDQSSAYPIDKDTGGRSRRGFFSSLGRSFKELGLTIAADAIDVHTAKDKPSPTLAQKLTQAPGKLEVFFPARMTALLNLLYESEQELDNAMLDREVQTRFWGKVSIDRSCQNCGMCARFCPTEALSNEDNNEEHAATPLLNRPRASEIVHEFRCSDCIQCHLCEDVCIAGALHVSDIISHKELFDLEPALIKPHHDDALTQ